MLVNNPLRRKRGIGGVPLKFQEIWQTQLNDQNQNAILVLDLHDSRPVTVASKQHLKNMYVVILVFDE